jgi:DNA repair protein RAD50
MLENNIKDQEAQIKKARDDVSKSGYEAQIAERQSKARYIEDQRDQLSGELRTLSLDADARARLDIKRGEFKSKSNEIESMLAILSTWQR